MTRKAATTATQELRAKLDAIGRVQAAIEFELDGTIISANANFLEVMGYELDEIVGQHHRMFVDAKLAKSPEYAQMWRTIADGEAVTGEFRRVGKGGKDIWILGSYNPMLDTNGNPFKVVKFATDVTDEKLRRADLLGQLAAIHKAQAVIEFEPDGTIIVANPNFLSVMGYAETEVVGKHHSMFAEPAYATSADYEHFWDDLRAGKYCAGQFKRLGKAGKEVWIQASYNPILDADGNTFKIVKFATDITTEKLRSADHAGQIDAISRSQAVIEFEPDGTIISANDNFLAAMGYEEEELVGQHHSMFADPEYATSAEYRQFWQDLRAGTFSSGQYRRIGSGGREVWIQASYNPIFDADGRVFKVVKYASDITAEKLRSADFQGQLQAISRSQAVIEFETDGTIITANQNFLDALGYEAPEVVDKHHSMFAEPQLAASTEYRRFWEDLRTGKFSSGQFKRLGKGGKEIWIQASYNPIFDDDGRVFKVVKYATDITEDRKRNADYAGQLQAIGRSQAVIEFEPDGTIITANENFLSALGYGLGEVAGQHHSMFAEPEYAASREYREFWDELREGKFSAGQFKRIGKRGKEVWIQASYNPIFDDEGRVFKVVKYATDITEDRTQEALYRSEVRGLYEACTQGRMSHRGDSTELRGERAEMLNAVNEILDVVSGPVDRLREQLVNIAAGDLTAYITDDYQGDHAALKDALNNTLDALNNTLTRVQSVATSVANGSREVSDSSHALSQGATEQAAALQEISSTMENITGQTKQNAENATVAADLSEKARDNANRGDDLMKQLGAAMGEVDDSSRKIRKVIKVIDDIAFQTNLLALNAAVEAARAGAHGRGFAVVAEEVRTLAGRSAKAAAETTEMIEDSITKVNVTSETAKVAADSLSAILEGTSKVNDLVREIAAASQQQAGSISEIDEGITQIDKVTQTNTASAEQGAAAAGDLSRQARQLEKDLSAFTLKPATDDAETLASLPPEVLAKLTRMLEGHAANGGSFRKASGD